MNNILTLISVSISNWNNVQIFEDFFLFILELFWDFGIGNSSIECWVQQIRAESRHLPGCQCAATWQHQLSTWTPYQLWSSANQRAESDICLWRLSLSIQPISAHARDQIRYIQLYLLLLFFPFIFCHSQGLTHFLFYLFILLCFHMTTFPHLWFPIISCVHCLPPSYFLCIIFFWCDMSHMSHQFALYIYDHQITLPCTGYW